VSPSTPPPNLPHQGGGKVDWSPHKGGGRVGGTMSPPVFPSLDGRGKGRGTLEANNPLLTSPIKGEERWIGVPIKGEEIGGRASPPTFPSPGWEKYRPRIPLPGVGGVRGGGGFCAHKKILFFSQL